MIMDLGHSLATMYPFAPLRGDRITRLEERRLGPFQLDATAAGMLGREQIGLFVGNCATLPQVVNKLLALSETEFPARWVAVLASDETADFVYEDLRPADECRPRSVAPKYWERGTVIFTTPEWLKDLARSRVVTQPVAGILVIDTLCQIHKASERVYRGRGMNDRPQRIANFRASLAHADWQPPFIFFTNRPAKSLNTEPMLSPYCLDAWWFVDGSRLRIGKPPAATALPFEVSEDSR